VPTLVQKDRTVFRYRLDPTTRAYVTAGIDTGTLTVRAGQRLRRVG
jgi:hypothetical protein